VAEGRAAFNIGATGVADFEKARFPSLPRRGSKGRF